MAESKPTVHIQRMAITGKRIKEKVTDEFSFTAEEKVREVPEDGVINTAPSCISKRDAIHFLVRERIECTNVQRNVKSLKMWLYQPRDVA